MLAATVRVTRDIDLAEECVQDAYADALQRWTAGVPSNPGAWLTTVAKRRAVDLIRRDERFQRLLPHLVVDELPPADGVPDDRLRLIFTCCHPALDPQTRIALTLRLLGGLTTAEVARAFLVTESTMAARITRGKKKIAVARIPYRMPTPADLPARVEAVLDVVRLVYTTGHAPPDGPELVRADLTGRAVELARLLRALQPDSPDVAAVLAMLLFHESRAAARTATGELILLADQDRSRWDTVVIDEARALVRQALGVRPPGRFAVEAAIAALHAEAPTFDDTDWPQIVALYDVLFGLTESPVVALNRAVAMGFAAGFDVGLAVLDELAAEPRLGGYGYLAAARADFLRRLGRVDEARQAYGEALLLTANTAERRFLTRRLDELG